MRAIICLVLLSLIGCSITFVKDPPDPAPPPGHEVECTELKVLPVLDFGFAAATIGYGVNVMANLDSEPNYWAAAGLISLLMSPWVVSGVTGMIWTSKCSAIKSARPAT
jgi:hypothetical protein